MTARAARPWLALALITTAVVLPLSAANPLQISVAISLAPAVRRAIAETDAQQAPRIHAAASGVLLQQIRHGAPTDLLIAASPHEVDTLIDAGLADPATRRVLASNRLVLVSTQGMAAPTRAALEDGTIRSLAVANPRTAPLGRYTRSWLEHVGLGAAPPFRLIVAESARQTLEYAARGEVDAAVIYASDASRMADRLTRGEAIDPGSHEPVTYVGVVLTASSQPDAALALLERLAGPSGRGAFLAEGFVLK